MDSASWALSFLKRKGDNPFDVQFALQEMMQQLVGIVQNVCFALLSRLMRTYRKFGYRKQGI
jgi:hypothetical protein